ncbi:Hypothetical protein SCF082_LOCUS29192, partial [Durusdinium trenchii]
MERETRSGQWDWVVWADCDTYFMNMSTTLDSVLFTYAGVADGEQLTLDPEVHMIVSEDNAMLNTGIFFARSSSWASQLLQRIWGSDTSPWIDHPWWENAAFTWQFLKDWQTRCSLGSTHSVSMEDLEDDPMALWKISVEHFWRDNAKKFALEDLEDWAAKGKDDMWGVYPDEVRVAPQSHFNSYHPITSRFQHDTWEEGKFVIAFNGVLSASSPTVVRILYGNYYQRACDLNHVPDCLDI